MKAIKENKVYTVDKTTKAAYLAQGYDIYDDKDKLIEKAPAATVPYTQYEALQAENKKLKAEVKELKAAEKTAEK